LSTLNKPQVYEALTRERLSIETEKITLKNRLKKNEKRQKMLIKCCNHPKKYQSRQEHFDAVTVFCLICGGEKARNGRWV